MSAQTCSHPLRGGTRCQNPVGPSTTRCAAGHRPQKRLPDGRVQMGPCRMLETEAGWACETHDLESEEWQVLLALGARPPCRAPVDYNDRFVLAEDPGTPSRTLALLSWDEDAVVRWRVAGNPSTPASALEQLARDKNEMVRQWVARNPRAPASVLERLARDGNATMRGWVSWNPSTPASALEQLARDKNEMVRTLAHENMEQSRA